MTVILRAMLLIAAVSVFGCGAARQLNPELDICTTACIEKKNACMLTATAANAIASCDSAHKACMEPCMTIPRYMPVMRPGSVP